MPFYEVERGFTYERLVRTAKAHLDLLYNKTFE